MVRHWCLYIFIGVDVVNVLRVPVLSMWHLMYVLHIVDCFSMVFYNDVRCIDVARLQFVRGSVISVILNVFFRWHCYVFIVVGIDRCLLVVVHWCCRYIFFVMLHFFTYFNFVWLSKGVSMLPMLPKWLPELCGIIASIFPENKRKSGKYQEFGGNVVKWEEMWWNVVK